VALPSEEQQSGQIKYLAQNLGQSRCIVFQCFSALVPETDPTRNLDANAFSRDGAREAVISRTMTRAPTKNLTASSPSWVAIEQKTGKPQPLQAAMVGVGTMKSIDNKMIGKLLRLLGSDKPGEVLAAVDALKRTLAASGRNMHDLANAAACGFQQPPEPVVPSWNPPESSPAPDPFDWDRYEEEAAERRYWDRRFDELRERYARGAKMANTDPRTK
jgi:hypothetical protein